jgi:hypothetical protein
MSLVARLSFTATGSPWSASRVALEIGGGSHSPTMICPFGLTMGAMAWAGIGASPGSGVNSGGWNQCA